MLRLPTPIKVTMVHESTYENISWNQPYSLIYKWPGGLEDGEKVVTMQETGMSRPKEQQNQRIKPYYVLQPFFELIFLL